MCENNTLRGRRGGSAEPAIGEEKFAASAARSLWQTPSSPLSKQSHLREFDHQTTPRQLATTARTHTGQFQSNESSSSSGFLSGQFLPSEVTPKPSSASVQRSSSLHSHLPRPNTMFETGSSFPPNSSRLSSATVVPLEVKNDSLVNSRE